MAYTNFTNCTEQEYLDIIYSQDDKNRIRIWFNNVELQDAGNYCESLSGTNRILPNDGEKRFSLDNFVAKEYNLVLRDLPVGTTIEDQVKISIGTLVDENTYEDVPIGTFNIQDTPTTDKNKITIKLRDNRVKFDFGYNAQPLIENEGGTASLKEILDDICLQAGVTNDVSSFAGDDIEVSIYDSSIKGSAYVSYIAEQAGAVPIITREGHLDFIYLNNLKTWHIPLSIVEKYEIGTPFTVERVVYESGVIKYETSNDETLETLYLDAANPYITSQEQVDEVFNVMEDFTIDSCNTGRILGNPAIDPYDLIEIYDDDTSDIILTTLANNTYSFNGVHRHTFETTIGKEERKENVTINSDETFKKTVKTEIDNVNAELTLKVEKDNVISAINLSTESASINSSKISLAGKTINLTSDIINISSNNFSVDASGNISAKGGTIAGYTINDNELYAITRAPYNYNQSDLTKIQNYIMGTGTLTPQEKAKYDINGDGDVTPVDYIIIKNLIEYGITTSNGLKVELHTGKSMLDSAIKIEDENGTEFTKLDIKGLSIGGVYLEKDDIININNLVNDTGWVNISTIYGGTWDFAQIRKIGKTVHLRAHASTFANGTSAAIFTIPQAFIPAQREYFYGFTQGQRISRWYVLTDGTVGVDWTRNISDGSADTGSRWHEVDATWFVD